MASVIALHLLNLRLFATFRLRTSRNLARLLWIKPASFSGKQICGAETRSAPLGICSSEDSARPGALLWTLRGFLVAEQMLNHSSRHWSCGTRGYRGGIRRPAGCRDMAGRHTGVGIECSSATPAPIAPGPAQRSLLTTGMSSRGYLCGVLTYGAGAM